MNRTPAQFVADRRRSHKASAKREQKNAARMFALRQKMIANGYNVSSYTNALTTTSTMARKHLNFILTGQYADFV